MLEGLGLGGRELADPAWREWFDRLKRAGVTGLSADISPEGSNQLRGYSAQPDYLTTGETFMGRQNVGSYNDMVTRGLRGRQAEAKARRDLQAQLQHDEDRRYLTEKGR